MFYWDSNFGGKTLTLTKDTPTFVPLGWNDKASSAKITHNPVKHCVTLFQDIDFKGKKTKICGENSDFVKIGWNDKVSSVKIPKGIKVVFYVDINFKGKNLVLTKNTANLVKLGWNDKASSAQVLSNTNQACANIYEHINYGGKVVEICDKVPTFVPIGFKDKISSVKVPKGVKVTLYWSNDFKGKHLELTKDNPDLRKQGWNDKAASAAVVSYKGALDTDLVPGLYKIINVNSNKCLDVTGVSMSGGANIVQWECHNGTNQKWDIKIDNNNFATLTAQHSKMVLNVKGGSKDKGADLIQWKGSNAPNEKWILKKESGVYKIISSSSKKCADAYEGNKNNGGKVVQVILLLIGFSGIVTTDRIKNGK